MPKLTPTEVGRETGLHRRDVIALCMQFGVPIFQGRIDLALFIDTVKRRDATEAARYTVLDGTGNLIDSFDNEAAARDLLDTIVRENPDAADDVALIAYDASGHPVGDPVLSQSTVRP